jgi:hypothetical protein
VSLKNVSECIEIGRTISHYYPKVLPAKQVIFEANQIANGWFDVSELGVTQGGHAIQLMSSRGNHDTSVLLYGFADPGEAVGATGLLGLMKLIKDGNPFLSSLNVKWNFIPCLNMDDQPNEGKTLEKTMKTDQQEVDWLVNDPRPETTALLELSKKLKPDFVFPLHDEWHCHEKIPCYIPTSHVLPPHTCSGLRGILEIFGFEISSDMVDPEMGAGFLNMLNVPDIKNSTFYEFSKSGHVFICEVPDLLTGNDQNAIAAQMAAGLFAMSDLFRI